MTYPSLALANLYVPLRDRRNVVRERIVQSVRIEYRWTDGERGCCETWKHDGEHRISRAEALYRAGQDGWIIVEGFPVCPCHQDDDDPELADLTNMVKHLESIGT